MTTPSLRPLGIGEILDAGIKVVLRHWKPLAIAIGGLTLPIWTLFVLVLASIDEEQLEFAPESTGEEITTGGAVALIVLAVALLASFAIAFTACFKIVNDAWLGSAADIRESLSFGLRRSWKVALLTLIWYVGLTLAFLALIIPFFWLVAMWCVAIPAMLFEGGGPFKALKRSYSLIKGRYWATLLLLVVSYLLVTIIATIVQYGVLGVASIGTGESTVALAVAQIVGFTLGSAITYPYLAAVLTILYVDQRVRKEGFDLQLLAESLGGERDPDAPLPAPLLGDEPYTPEQRAAAPYWPPPPGWVPPPPSGPPAPEPASQWSSAGGWAAPSPEPEEERPRWNPPPPDSEQRVSLDKKRTEWLPPDPGGS